MKHLLLSGLRTNDAPSSNRVIDTAANLLSTPKDPIKNDNLMKESENVTISCAYSVTVSAPNKILARDSAADETNGNRVSR